MERKDGIPIPYLVGRILSATEQELGQWTEDPAFKGFFIPCWLVVSHGLVIEVSEVAHRMTITNNSYFGDSGVTERKLVYLGYLRAGTYEFWGNEDGRQVYKLNLS